MLVDMSPIEFPQASTVNPNTCTYAHVLTSVENTSLNRQGRAPFPYLKIVSCTGEHYQRTMQCTESSQRKTRAILRGEKRGEGAAQCG